MAKDNLFLGMARGAIGDVVFARQGGQQVARARNRSPKNPRSVAQMVQRIILSTAGKAYSLTQELTDHSFQGKSEGAESQQEFMRANVAWLRELCAPILADPTEESIEENGRIEHFNYAGDSLPVMNPYVIALGTLPVVHFAPFGGQASAGYYEPVIQVSPVVTPQVGYTYAEVASHLGLQVGDQLTFVCLVGDARNTEARSFVQRMVYSRIILAPDNGDGSKAMFNTEGSLVAANLNSKNQNLTSESLLYDPEARSMSVSWAQGVGDPGSVNAPLFGGVIVSRFSNNIWQRSNCILQLLHDPVNPIGEDSLLGAYRSYQIGRASGLYLNQAES